MLKLFFINHQLLIISEIYFCVDPIVSNELEYIEKSEKHSGIKEQYLLIIH